mmetsp:Transcript_49570/g.105488  ORF Transcript_49570/g.105488 Transcript_49570/m.105488 type:complete len:245 (+) Transcript_49570:574-1308(+)
MVYPPVGVSLGSNLPSRGLYSFLLAFCRWFVIFCFEQHLSFRLCADSAPRITAIGSPNSVALPQYSHSCGPTRLNIPTVLQRVCYDVPLCSLESVYQSVFDAGLVDVSVEPAISNKHVWHCLDGSSGNHVAEGAVAVEGACESVAIVEVGHREVVLVRSGISETLRTFLASDNGCWIERNLSIGNSFSLVSMRLPFSHNPMHVPDNLRLESLLEGLIWYDFISNANRSASETSLQCLLKLFQLS